MRLQAHGRIAGPMKRRLFTILSVASLLLFGWVVFAWVQSYGPVVSQFILPEHEIVAIRGQVIYYWWFNGVGLPWLAADWRYLGFGFEDRYVLTVRIPFWFLAILALATPAWWLRTLIRNRASATLGLCRRCGYDLRASKERCPECGTPNPVQTTGGSRQA